MKKNIYSISLLSFVFFLVTIKSSAQPDFVSIGSNLPGTIKNMTVFNGQLLIGGAFDCCNSVAKWNGTSWDSLYHDGTLPFNGTTRSLQEFNSELYLGGYYSNPKTNLPYGHILKWNGQKFQEVFFGFQDIVNSLMVYNNNLYAAGEFQNLATGFTVNHIARLNSGWYALSIGVDGGLNCMANFNGKLYVAGYFKYAGFVDANQIASWDGTVWTPVGDNSRLFDELYSMIVYNNELYVGGSFGVAKFNGTNWTNLGSGTVGGLKTVYCMEVYNNQLYAGGEFLSIGGTGNNNIARWDGNSWHSISTGINGKVTALKVYNGSLFVGGSFTKAGNLTVKNIVKIKDPAVGLNDYNVTNFSIYPNPSKDGTITISTGFPIENTSVKFYNSLGVDLSSEINKEFINNFIVCSNIPAGNYIVEISNTNGIERKKLVIMK